MEIREALLLIGPNRRSDNTVLEQQLVLGPRELAALAQRIEPHPAASHAYDGHIQPTAFRQLIQRGKDILVRQISGDSDLVAA